MLLYSLYRSVSEDPGFVARHAGGGQGAAPLAHVNIQPEPADKHAVVRSSARLSACINAAATVDEGVGQADFCKKCAQRRPDRAHHCKVCKRCVKRMDHVRQTLLWRLLRLCTPHMRRRLF